MSKSHIKEIDMSTPSADGHAKREPWLPVTEQADAVTAALDRVLQTPTLPNRIAACVAVQAYLAATEHLWSNGTKNASR